MLGSKRRMFETSFDDQAENCQNVKRFKSGSDYDDSLESSSFRCLETLVKLILTAERQPTH